MPLATDSLTFDFPAGALVDAIPNPVPAGFHPLDVSAVIGSGRDVFARAGAELLNWAVQRKSGLTVTGVDGLPAKPVQLGDRAALTVKVGPLPVRAPLLVVAVVREVNRIGFSYGTLPGHPESGEEAFVVSIADDDTVTLTIRALSRPTNWFWALGAPVAKFQQRKITRRYLASLTLS